MVRREIRFTVQKCNGVVTNIGKSVIYQPQVRFGGGSIKWYEDKRKEKMKSPLKERPFQRASNPNTQSRILKALYHIRLQKERIW